jgi:tRNA(Leu) C34 or U34 (ribose-2'-O)-methylase TrmL
MRTGLRSLNVAMAAAMAVGEAMRQIASSGAEAVAHAGVQKARGG